MSAPWLLWRSMPPRYQLSLERKEQPKPREKKGEFLLEPQRTNQSQEGDDEREMKSMDKSVTPSDMERLLKRPHPAFPCRRSAYLHHMKVQGRVNSAKTFINEHPSVIPSRPHTRAKSAPNLLEKCAVNKTQDPLVPTREYTADSRNLYYRIRHDPRFTDKVVDIPESYDPEPESPPERSPSRKASKSATRLIHKKVCISPENTTQFQYVAESPLITQRHLHHNVSGDTFDEDQEKIGSESGPVALGPPPCSPSNTCIIEDPLSPSIPPMARPDPYDQNSSDVVQEYALRTDDILRYYADKDCGICKHITEDISIYQQSLMSCDGHQKRMIENSFLTGRPLMDYLESHTPKEITKDKVHRIFLGNVRDHFSLDTIQDPLEINNTFFQLNRPSVLYPRKDMALHKITGMPNSEVEARFSRPKKFKPPLLPYSVKEKNAVKVKLSMDNQLLTKPPGDSKESPRKATIKYAEIVIPSATESESGTLLGLSPRKVDMNATI